MCLKVQSKKKALDPARPCIDPSTRSKCILGYMQRSKWCRACLFIVLSGVMEHHEYHQHVRTGFCSIMVAANVFLSRFCLSVEIIPFHTGTGSDSTGVERASSCAVAAAAKDISEQSQSIYTPIKKKKRKKGNKKEKKRKKKCKLTHVGGGGSLVFHFFQFW